MSKIKVGQCYPTRMGDSVTVVEVKGWDNIIVKFNDDGGYLTRVQSGQLNAGNIKNPYRPNVYNVGYMGVGSFTARIKGTVTIEYQMWSNMLQRCYSSVWHDENPSYVNCTVAPEWHNFQNFAMWCTAQPYYTYGYELDKDILNPGNRIYSPIMCALVPKEINGLFIDNTNLIRDNGLPIGVKVNHKRYQARTTHVALGTYDTPDEAHHVYLDYILNYKLQILFKYKGNIDERVYYAALAQLYSQYTQ